VLFFFVTFAKTPTRRVPTGLTSTSLDRAPGPSNTFVRGKSGFVPFWPGGLEEVSSEPPPLDGINQRNRKGLRTIPPGFSRGLRLPGDVGDNEALLSIEDESGRPRRADDGVHPHSFTLNALIRCSKDYEVDDADFDEVEVPPHKVAEIDDLLPTSVCSGGSTIFQLNLRRT
jgi:antiviral helicase SKI2